MPNSQTVEYLQNLIKEMERQLHEDRIIVPSITNNNDTQDKKGGDA